MEPATKQDLKDFLKELREELRESIKEAFAEAFGNTKPALEHATTSTASQLVAMDAKVPPPACSSPDQGTSALYLAPTATIDIVPKLDVDVTGVATPAPTICSTDGLNHNADGDDHMAAWQATWSAPTPFNLPQEASPTLSLCLFVDLAIPTPTTCLIHVRDLDAGDIRVTEVPMFTPAVDWSIKQHGQVLRPMPWPSFACRSESTYGKRPYPTPPVQAALLSFWTDQTLPPGRASMKIGATVPRIAEKGEKGPKLWLDLELKLVAAVGIVGAPNAGQSTLFTAISAAKPTITNYQFTTLLPNIGVVSLDIDAMMVVADLPGLLEGAHPGYGLGHEFLRHSERCSVLVQVVDGSGEQPEYEYVAVRLELELFSPSSVDKHIGTVHLMRITVLGQFVRKWKFKGTWDYAVKSTEATIKLQPTGLLCSPLPPAKTPDNHKKVILILAEMQHMITQFNGFLNHTKILSVVVLVSQSRGRGENIYDPLSRFLPCSVELSDFLLNNDCPNENRLTYRIAGTPMSKFVGLNLGNRTCYGRVLPRAATALQAQQKCCIIWEPRPPWSQPMQLNVSSSEGKYFLSDSVPRFQMADHFGMGTVTVYLTSDAASTSFVYMFAQGTSWEKATANYVTIGWVYPAHKDQSYMKPDNSNNYQEGTNFKGKNIWYSVAKHNATEAFLISGANHAHEPLSKLERGGEGLAIYICSTCAWVSVLNLSCEVWFSCALHFSFEMRVVKSTTIHSGISVEIQHNRYICLIQICLSILLTTMQAVGGVQSLFGMTSLESPWREFVAEGMTRLLHQPTGYKVPTEILHVHQTVHVAYLKGQSCLFRGNRPMFMGARHLQEPCPSSKGFICEMRHCGAFSSVPRAEENHYQRVLCNREEVTYLLSSWSHKLLAYQLAGTILLALIFTTRRIRILGNCCCSKMSTPVAPQLQQAGYYATGGIKQALYWACNLRNEYNFHSSTSCSCGLLETHNGNDVTLNIREGLFLPGDPGVSRIIFEHTHGERNPHFIRQVLLTISCSSLMDGVEFSTGRGQALFQGGRSFTVFATFVDHKYYLDLVRVNYDDDCDHKGYSGNPGKQACYFDLVYTDLGYYHEDYHGDPSKMKGLQAPWDPGKSAF